MTSLETELIVGLRSHRLSKDEFLKRFPLQVDFEYIVNALGTALAEKRSTDVENTLFVGFMFSLFVPEHCKILCALLLEPWHISHEDIASILQSLKLPESIDALYETAKKRFGYLEYNDSMALAVKCVWALARIGNEAAREKIKLIAASDEREDVKQAALSHLID